MTEKREHGALSKLPKAPSRLPPEAREIWTDTCNYLLATRTLHSGDLTTVEAFCSAAIRLRKLEAILDEQGAITPEGKAHPGVAAANGTAAATAKLAGALGLAPVSRARLSGAVRSASGRPAGSDEWLQVLKGGKR